MDQEILKVFEPFPKIPRLSKAGGCVITEKIDGTNAQIYIAHVESEDFYGKSLYTAQVGEYYIYCGSRSRLINVEDDNYGFAQWVFNNRQELVRLGPGRHYGEWWGQGIQRNYGLKERKFSLFNVRRWSKVPPEELPNCVSIIPVLKYCPFEISTINETLAELAVTGSIASPGYMNPEGIIIYQFCTEQLFKKTFNDNHKGEIDENIFT